MKQPLIYIASPYAGDIEKNTAFAISCCQYAIRQGCTPIAPHLLYPQILNDTDPSERACGLAMGRQLLTVCSEVWVCGGQISAGMKGEIEYALEQGVPIRHISAEVILKEAQP